MTDAEGDAITITVTGVRMGEPDDFGLTAPFPARILGGGSGVTTSGGTVAGLVQLRGERNGVRQTPGNGRVYHILFTAPDGHGGSCTADKKVGVRFAAT